VRLLATSSRPTKLQQFRTGILRTSPGKLVALAQVGALLLLAELLLRTVPFPKVAKAFRVTVPASDGHPQGTTTAPFILSRREKDNLWAVRRLAPEIYGEERGCLRRSVVLGFLLREHAPLLRIGVQRDSGQHLRAHAWIDVGGLVVDAGSDFVSLNG
jgi:hypothetical protein